MPSNSPAERLLQQELENGWKVVERYWRTSTATGGCFSAAYIVAHVDGRRAFLKALDFSAALSHVDPPKELLRLTSAYVFERDVLSECRDRRMSRVVSAIEFGAVQIDSSQIGRVPYMILELADYDIRKAFDISASFDAAWAFRSLHDIAIALFQLHTSGIVHQDVKPSNALFFSQQGCTKLGDLGQAVATGHPSPLDARGFAGDPAYAPIEYAYHVGNDSPQHRRFGSDAFLFGSLVVYYFDRLTVTAGILRNVPRELHPDRWNGTYEEVLPFLRKGFNDFLGGFASPLPHSIRAPLLEVVRELCDPDPALRGPRKTRHLLQSSAALQRYASRMDYLAQLARSEIRKAL